MRRLVTINDFDGATEGCARFGLFVLQGDSGHWPDPFILVGDDGSVGMEWALPDGRKFLLNIGTDGNWQSLAEYEDGRRTQLSGLWTSPLLAVMAAGEGE